MKRLLTRGLLLGLPGILISLAGCRTLIKPLPPTAFVEECQGQYDYTDSTQTYTGRFILFSFEDKLAIDLFALYFPMASIRHSPESTAVYLPASAELLLLGPDDYLPLKGWEVPLAPLAAAYKGVIPENPDSSVIDGDTTFFWMGETAYMETGMRQRLAVIRGRDWLLTRDGELEGTVNRDRASKIVFTRYDAVLELDFVSFEIKEAQPAKVFGLDLPPGIEKIDYR